MNCCCAFTSRGRMDAAGTRGSDSGSAAAAGGPEEALTSTPFCFCQASRNGLTYVTADASLTAFSSCSSGSSEQESDQHEVLRPVIMRQVLTS